MKSNRKARSEREFSIADVLLRSDMEGGTEFESQRIIGRNKIERTGRIEPEDIPGIESIEFRSVTTYGRVRIRES